MYLVWLSIDALYIYVALDLSFSHDNHRPTICCLLLLSPGGRDRDDLGRRVHQLVRHHGREGRGEEGELCAFGVTLTRNTEKGSGTMEPALL